MKKLLLSACLLATSLVASAQFTPTFKDAGTAYRVSYSPMSLDFDNSYMEDWKFKGVSFEYVKSFGVVEEMPIFLEVGAGLQWLNDRESEEQETTLGDKKYEMVYKTAVNIFSLNVPINIGYKFTLQDNITVMPYVGLNARVNLLANTTSKIKADDYYEALEKQFEETLGENWKEKYKEAYGEEYKGADNREKSSLFDKDKRGEYTLKRFLLGWQIGATATYENYSFGISYGSCFTDEIINKLEDCKFGGATISVGYTF